MHVCIFVVFVNVCYVCELILYVFVVYVNVCYVCKLILYVCIFPTGRSGHVLRVMDQSNGNRGLLKEFVGSVLDVSFAHFHSDVLACIDQGGNVYIWQISTVDNKVVYPTP